MKIYAFYTPSHTLLAERHFIPSAERFLGASNVECLLASDQPQGEHGTRDFNLCCLEKVRQWIEICSSASEPLILSDVDIRLYGDVSLDLCEHSAKHDHDAYFQWDGPSRHCMGFVYARNPRKVAELLRQVEEVMLRHPDLEDQQSLRLLLKEDRPDISLGILPTWKYWTAGLSGREWFPGDRLRVPDGLLMHHANWTAGADRKLVQLDAVYEIVRNS